MSTFFANHPMLSLLLYVLICFGAGISIYFIWFKIRSYFELKLKMKGRVKHDKLD